MTPITRKLSRESIAVVHSAGRRRPVIVGLKPPGDLVYFRLKGTRTSYALPIAWCYMQAVTAERARLRAERKAKRLQEAR